MLSSTDANRRSYILRRSSAPTERERCVVDIDPDNDNVRRDNKDNKKKDAEKCCCCSKTTCLFVVTLTVLGWVTAANALSAASRADTDMAFKYDTLTSMVPATNSWLWNSARAGDTMHQAVGAYGMPPDPRHLDKFIADEALRRLALGCGGLLQMQTRVFDAGSGWGGTSFALERAIAAEAAASMTEMGRGAGREPVPSVIVDGASLSKIQVSAAAQLARERGVGDHVHFHLMSYDDVGSSSAAKVGGGGSAGEEAASPSATTETWYDLAVAVESLCHSRDLRRTFGALSRALRPTNRPLSSSSSSFTPSCSAAHLIIVEDVLVAASPEEAKEEKSHGAASADSLLRDYRTHWAGSATSPFPLTEEQWRGTLATDVGVIDLERGRGGGGGGHLSSSSSSSSIPSSSSSSSSALHRNLDLKILDLGAVHGLRLHNEGPLRVLHAVLSAAHAMSMPLAYLTAGFSPPIFPAIESYLSSYIGAIARERLLVAGHIKYAIISASRDMAS